MACRAANAGHLGGCDKAGREVPSGGLSGLALPSLPGDLRLLGQGVRPVEEQVPDRPGDANPTSGTRSA